MARINEDSFGGFDEGEARRRAIQNRLAQGGQTGGSIIERAGLVNEGVPTSQPTVAENAGPSGAQARPSVLERNEQAQAGPFAGGEDPETRRENLRNQAVRGFDLQAAIAAANAKNASTQRAPAPAYTPPPPPVAQQPEEWAAAPTPQQREVVNNFTPPAPPPPPSPFQTNLDRWGVGSGSTGAEQDRYQDALRSAPVPGLGTVAAGIGRLVGGSPLARAIGSRLGRAAAPAARTVGPAAADRAGLGFRLVGGADEGAEVFTGAQRAARARTINAGLREAAGVTDDAAAAAARQAAQGTQLGQAITSRIGRVPLVRAVNPATSVIGGGAGAIVGSGVLRPGTEAGTEPGNQGAPANQQPQVAPAQPAPVQTTPPGTQPPQTTPPLPGAPGNGAPTVGGAPRGTYTPAPQFGTTPRVAPPVAPGTSPAGRPPLTPPDGQQRVSVNPIVEGRRPPFGRPPFGRPPVGGDQPYGATPGWTPTGPTTGPVSEGPLNSDAMRQQVVADLNGIAEIINAGPQSPDVMAIFASQGSKLLELIAEQEKQLRAQAESEGRTIDPATQNTLDVLREQLGLQLKQTREGLASRGILDSGITIEAEQMLRKGNLSDQAKILSERLTSIQNNLNQGLGQFRQQRVQSASTFGMAGAQAQTQAEMAERQRMDDLRQTLVQGRMGLGAQYSNEEQSELNRQNASELSELDRQAAVARLQADIAARSGDQAAEIAARSREAELNRRSAETIAGMNNAARSQPTPAQQRTTDADQRAAQVEADTQKVITEILNTPGIDVSAAIRGAYGQPGFENVDWPRVLAEASKIGPPPKPQDGFKWPWEP